MSYRIGYGHGEKRVIFPQKYADVCEADRQLYFFRIANPTKARAIIINERGEEMLLMPVGHIRDRLTEPFPPL
jgi:hypothetical protein